MPNSVPIISVDEGEVENTLIPHPVLLIMMRLIIPITNLIARLLLTVRSFVRIIFVLYWELLKSLSKGYGSINSSS